MVRDVSSDDEAELDPLGESVSGHKADLEALRSAASPPDSMSFSVMRP